MCLFRSLDVSHAGTSFLCHVFEIDERVANLKFELWAVTLVSLIPHIVIIITHTFGISMILEHGTLFLFPVLPESTKFFNLANLGALNI